MALWITICHSTLWCAGGPIPGVHGPANDGETEGDSGEGWCPLVRLGRVLYKRLKTTADAMFRDLIAESDERNLDDGYDGGNATTPLLERVQLKASHEVTRGLGFPSTRYYGSKKRQLDWLREEFVKVRGKTVLDAFGGTGAVSHLWRNLGWNVTYNDTFTFNCVSANALFSSSTHIYSEERMRLFLESVRSETGFIAQTFSGLYFFDNENEWLDGLAVALEGEEEAFRYLVLHCAFQACLQKRPFNLFHRANLHLRTSTVDVKFGNRTTWARPFVELMLNAYREVARLQLSSMRLPVYVNRPTAVADIEGVFDVVYIDPPYFKQAKKTESYLERYHFLEGLSRYREWPHMIDMNSPLKQIRRDVVREWAEKSDFRQNLVGLIEKYRSRQVILSYVSGEYPSELDLLEIFKDNFDRVRLVRRSFSRALSKKKFFEILLIGRP
ncbi:adenine methyltransferase [Burkholderia gladioli]